MQQHGSQRFAHRDTLDPRGGGQTVKPSFSESSHATYQIKGN